MCGISGIVGLKSPLSGTHDINAATDSLAHRGPDDSGNWSDLWCCLGHRRLSIIDTSNAGHQPMHSINNRYHIVFNGEIYNYKEVKKELDSLGLRSWKSNSDTEVLIEAYSQWGVNCLDKINGMFAFAIWDSEEKTLFIARDRIGEKPLYYSICNNSLAFASRPSAIFCLLPEKSNDLNREALSTYLTLGFTPSPMSIYDGIIKLPPAHYLIVQSGEVTQHRYWSPVNYIKTSRPNIILNDTLDELDFLLTQAVESRMVSDVPIGFFLSGGVDSSMVVAMARKKSASNLLSFSMGFDEPSHDERPFAKQVADHVGTTHYDEAVTIDQLLDLFPVFFKVFDEPFADSSVFPTLALSRLTSKSVKVALSGDGGDEIFGGYHYYQLFRKIEFLFTLPKSVRSGLASSLSVLPDARMQALGMVLKAESRGTAFAVSRSIAKWLGRERLFPWGSSGMSSGLEVFARLEKSLPSNLSAPEIAMVSDLSLILPDDYLEKVDGASMAFSLESRAPLIDHRLVEWSLGLPVSMKIRPEATKYLLRQLAYRYFPKSWIDRPKQGFGIPVDRWLRTKLFTHVENALRDRELIDYLGLDPVAVHNIWIDFIQGNRRLCNFIWSLWIALEFSRRVLKKRQDLFYTESSLRYSIGGFS